MKQKPIYLDYAASTPVDKEVLRAMEPYFSDKFGNPGSLHSFGREANAVLDKTRQAIADELGARFEEIIFTSSASEANDLVIDGIFEGSSIKNPKIIISGIEHESVSQTALNLKARGATVVVLPTSKDGFVSTETLREYLDSDTLLVSIIHGSNEIGTIQPIEEIGSIIRSFKEERQLDYPLFHTDAVQTFQFLKLDTEELGVDALTLSGQKIYGPKGVGVLYISSSFLTQIRPQLIGGSHEFGLRASTPNVPAIAGMGKAVELILQDRGGAFKKVQELRDFFWEELQKLDSSVEINGSLGNRLPNNLNVYFPGKENKEFIIQLDQLGIAASVGSACSIKATTASPAVMAMGYSDERARASVRFSLGKFTTKSEINEVLKRVASVL